MVSDPEPVEGLTLEDSQGAVAAPDSDRSDISGFLEPEGGMTGVSHPQLIDHPGPCSDLQGEGGIRGPEVRSCR